jgi:hypothetical protein
MPVKTLEIKKCCLNGLASCFRRSTKIQGIEQESMRFIFLTRQNKILNQISLLRRTSNEKFFTTERGKVPSDFSEINKLSYYSSERVLYFAQLELKANHR